MKPDAETRPPATAPSLLAIFLCFTAVGMQSFGGGISGWMRREVVQRRGWIGDQQFLSGLALCQISPGSTAVNLATFIGTTLRGAAGGIMAAAGLLLMPLAVVLALGVFYLGVERGPSIEAIFTGMGAAAIGLNLATGTRLTRRNIRNLGSASIMVVTAVAIGIFRLPLLPVLGVMIPLSLLVVWFQQRRVR